MSTRQSIFHQTNSNNDMNSTITSTTRRGMEAAEESTVKCLSCVTEGNQIALASYDEDKNEISIEESRIVPGNDDVASLIEGFKQRCQPNIIILGAKVASNQVLLDNLTKPLSAGVETDTNNQEDNSERTQAFQSQNSERNTNSSTAIPYRLLKSGAFDIRTCRSIILSKLRVLTLIRQQQQQRRNLQFGINDPVYPINSIRQYTTEDSSYHSLSSLINFDSVPSLRALGSLLFYLQGTVFKFEEGNTVTIHDIKNISSSLYMSIDDATFKSLHIFSTEYHPLRHGGACRGSSTHSKEGFSLFSLLNRTKSNMGKTMLREWMLKPLLSLHDIQIRHACIEIMLHSSRC